ncbi:MAG: hypothetical protein KME14_26625 [Tildeniella torsiva UHER 1998/13D]|jgi:hypothetical protein|nr:hypothetical protein [Tildeniella torsiva UHER 1998/13D]
MSNSRDRFTTASSQADKALTDFDLVEDCQSVDELAAKIFRAQFVQHGQSYAQAYVQAVRLLASVQ